MRRTTSSRNSARRRRSSATSGFTRRHVGVGMAAALAAPSLLYAQAVTNTWTAALGPNWSDPSKWFDNMAPPAGGSATTVLQFNAILNAPTATNDLGDPFQLQGIVFNSAAPDPFRVNSAALNSLQFTGSSPFITQSHIGAASFSVGTGGFVLNPTSGNFTINGSGLGNLTLAGIISETGGPRQVVINTSPSVLNAQVIAITGNNSAANSGFSGGLRLVSGNLALGLNNAAPGTGPITIEGGSVQLTSGIVISNGVMLESTLNFIGATSGTFSGVLSGKGGVTVAGTGAAVGLNLTGTNTYSGITTVDHGRIGTPNGRINPGTLSVLGAAGALTNTTELRIRSSGTVNLGDSVTGGGAGDRLNDDAAVSLGGGYLNLTSTASVSYTETIGVLTADSGNSAITLTPGSTAQMNLIASNLTRGADRGTLFIRGTGFSDAPANNKVSLTITNAPTLAGGGSPGTPDASIIPFLFADRSGNTGAGGSSAVGTVGFVTWDSGTQRLRLLDHSTEYVSSFGAVTGTTNNLLLAAGANPSAPVSINSLLVRNSAAQTIGTVGDVNAISFPTGNAAFLYSTQGMTINTPIHFNDNEGKIFANSSTTINGVISGTNGITKIGSAGALTLTASNTYSGPTTINGGTLNFASTSALGSSGQIILGGGVTGTTGTVGQAILQYTGASAATLTQDIKLASGLPEIRSTGGALTLSGVISGPGGLMINSSGVDIILTGNNTYTGQTRVGISSTANLVISSDANLGNGGVLDLGAGASAGLRLEGNWTTSRQVNMSFTSLLNTQAFDATLNGPLTGTSATTGLVKSGTGKLTLNAANPNTGPFTINAGTFEVNGSLAPSSGVVTIAAGASLAGSGSIYRPVTMTGASTLSPGNSVGTLRMNTLTLQSGNTLLFDVGTSSDLVELGGGLGTITLPASGSYTLRLGDTTGLAPGDFTLFTYGTRVNTLNPTVTGFPAGLKGSFSFGATSGVLTVLSLREYEWAPAGADSDGDGAWTQAPAGSGANWEIGTTPTTYDTTDDNANIGQGGTAGVITLGNAVSVRKIRFQPVSSGVYEIAQGTGNLSVIEGVEANNADGLISAGIAMTGGNTMTVGAGRTLDLNGVVSGAFGVTKEGPGLLRLGAANTYTGGTTVNDGILRLNAVGAYPAGTPLTVNAGGTFDLNGFDASVTTLSGTGLVNLGSTLTLTGGTQTVGAGLDGNGVLSFSTGVLTLSGNNADWSGGLTTTGTGLIASSPANLGTGPISITNATAAHTTTISLANGTSATVTNPIMLNLSGTGTQSQFTTGAAANTNVTLSGVISGSAGTSAIEALEFNGAAADTNYWILTNPANSFAGNIRVNEGGLAITSNGALGAAMNSIDIFNLSATVAGLRFDADGINMTHNVTLNGTSAISANGNNAQISGVVSATGSLNVIGGGVLTLSGANTYTGNTNVNAGTLRVTGTHFNGGTYTIAAGARLSGDGVITLAAARAVVVNGDIAPGTSVGQLTLNTSGTGGETRFAPGGSYEFEIDDAAGTAGMSPGWDKLNLSALNVTATAGSKFTVKINALPGMGGPGLDNFDPLQTYTWTIASATTITGFDVTKFAIDSTQFDNNNTNHGGFFLGFSGGDVQLTYVPEPASAALLVLGGAALLRRRRAGRRVDRR